MLSTTDVARMRTSVARSFVDTIVIKHRATTADAEGNPAGTLTLVATVAGRVAKPTPAELQIAAQAGQRLDRVLTLALGSGIKPGHLVEVAGERWKVGTVASSRVQTKANLARWEG